MSSRDIWSRRVVVAERLHSKWDGPESMEAVRKMMNSVALKNDGASSLRPPDSNSKAKNTPICKKCIPEVTK